MSEPRARLSEKVFGLIHGNRLIYNTCWEDPRADRQLLKLDASARVAMLTSAGCNALDYLLDDPAQIACVDLNLRQNALLDLKIAAIRRLDFKDFFGLFGEGAHRDYARLYQSVRADLLPASQTFWDQKISYFDANKGRGSFYFRGTAGEFAGLVNRLLSFYGRGLRQQILGLIEARDLATQQQLYAQIEPKLFNAFTRFLLKRDVTMAMLGVPRAQRQLIDRGFEGGLIGFIKAKLRRICTEVPMSENYFWRVYLTGRYTRQCAPNYLREENYALLRERLDRISIHTASLTDFLLDHRGRFSHFVLLDHQDWLAHRHPQAMRAEWDAIFANAAPGARILMRSAALSVDFLPESVEARLQRYAVEADIAQASDRVGTYGSTVFAGIAA
jgi:S-adenosylmethionine-diacylglycerol 3-amino-3-carboxypropyl transferase